METELRKEERKLKEAQNNRILISNTVNVVEKDPYKLLAMLISRLSDFKHTVKSGKFKAVFKGRPITLFLS